MNLFRYSFFILFTVALILPTRATEIGVREIRVAAPERGRELEVIVWYPAQEGGKPTIIGDSMIFHGMPASLNAPFLKGRFPLVVMSHGSGSSIQGMSWIAAALAKAGFVVAGPNHPRTTTGDSTPADTPRVWERTQDLSSLIDVLTSDPEWRNLIDAEQIGVIGFSLGGTTAMELAGARVALEAYARYCDTYQKWDCAWFAGQKAYMNGKAVKVEKVDLRKIDKARFEQSNLDRRIKSAVLVDPGMAQAFTPQSIKEIAIPMNFINLGGKEVSFPSANADHLAAWSTKGTYSSVSGAVHFSFLPECKSGATELLKKLEEPDPICEDGGSRSRADIHSELISLIVAALQRALKTQR